MSEIQTSALAMRGKKSISLIAQDLGVSRNVVAGIFFRASHPGKRQTGAGRCGPGKYAETTLSLGGGKPGRPSPKGVRVALGKIIDICGADAESYKSRCLAILEIAQRAADQADRWRDQRRAKTAGGRHE